MDADLEILTRDAFDRSIVDEVAYRMPIFAMLAEHHRVSFKGGKTISFPAKKATTEALTQAYSPNDPLTGGRQATLAQPKFTVRYVQHPVEYNVEDYILNADGSSDTTLLDQVDHLVADAHDGVRRYFNSIFYNNTTAESDKQFQSVIQALNHDGTYGQLTRATTVTNQWWQSPSLDQSYTDQDTAYAASLGNLKTAANKCRWYTREDAKLYVFVGDTIFDLYKSILESQRMYTKEGSRLMKYGFSTFVIDDTIEFVRDSYLTIASRDNDMVIMNPSTWKFQISPKRNFKMTKFFHQAAIVGGTDSWLARIFVAGNLVCNQPNANFWFSNMNG